MISVDSFSLKFDQSDRFFDSSTSHFLTMDPRRHTVFSERKIPQPLSSTSPNDEGRQVQAGHGYSPFHLTKALHVL
jgi:hypothetical protein